MKDIEGLSHEFENRFKDFDSSKSNLYLYNNPMDVDVETQLPEINWLFFELTYLCCLFYFKFCESLLYIENL